MRTMVMRALILTTLAVLTLTACSQNHSDENTSGEEVLLTVEHRSEWRQLWIEGATDLPDGAFVNFSVEHEIGRSTPSDECLRPTLWNPDEQLSPKVITGQS